MGIEDNLFAQDKLKQKNNKDVKDKNKNRGFVTKEMIKSAKLKQLQEQKRSGVENIEDLSGENG